MKIIVKKTHLNSIIGIQLSHLIFAAKPRYIILIQQPILNEAVSERFGEDQGNANN